MTDRKELENLIERTKQRGASVIVQENMDNGGNVYIETIQVIGLQGCGPYPMSPIAAAERLRELV